MRAILLSALAALTLASSATAADMPVFQKQTLTLSDIPAGTAKPVKLFNGKNLKDWDAWLGYADPGQTYSKDHAAPIGPAGKPDIFSVKTVDGKPVLHVSGRTWGSLIRHGDYANYHLRLQYKFTGKSYAPRLDQPGNNGLLYHTHGQPGAVWGTWSRAVEFEIMTGSVGMVVPVGAGLHVTSTVANDDSLIAPKLAYMAGAPENTVVGNSVNWNIANATAADKAEGEWNTLDLYVVGNHAVHVVNGVPVMEVWDICDPDASGACVPLTHGRIQLQSEGAETLFRDMTLEPIDHLPKIVVKH